MSRSKWPGIMASRFPGKNPGRTNMATAMNTGAASKQYKNLNCQCDVSLGDLHFMDKEIST
jgi:hypothetical protein